MSDRKKELNSKEYYMSTLAAELMYYRYLRARENMGIENTKRLEKETNMIGKFAGALEILGLEPSDQCLGGEYT